MDFSAKAKATEMLREDHRKVRELYDRFLAAQDPGARDNLLEDFCRQLETHTRLEECLVYPELAKDGLAGSAIGEFGRQHGEVKALISDLRLAHGEDRGLASGFDGILVRIMASLQLHVAEEEAVAFPVLAADPARDEALGEALAGRRLKLEVFHPIHKWIDVAAPVRTVYNQWTQFEAFPAFLDDVKEVRQLDDAHVRWRVEVGGKELQWTAEIYEQIPDRRIAWSSLDGAPHTGSVSFRPLAADSTRMLVELTYEPQGLVEDLGALLGVLSLRLSTELTRFRDFIESRGRESGGWRGRIEGNPIDPQLPGIGS